MSSNGITAKEAREATEISGFNAVEEALVIINNVIKISTQQGKDFAEPSVSKEGIDSSGLSFIVSDLQGRGFKVKSFTGDAIYRFKISW
ncbi:hypothetical protein MMG00_12675 [Ignatzschineria rhizosphaerae]|uniref:Uncharacterized protein n=1 Tax=Ignatzschineria rhizosphaerae TaxID=2923279 RepID=A0ABY3X152_9GAMM|nr:hypothetical protein [Ignatzschineria rhizosphaerae]UNM96035.1 hypothetical protein MMG00_12675 [Ignatzschineria rhizosphaerae]